MCKTLEIRKTFYKAGYILQNVFYMYREKMFDVELTKVETKDGKIYIYDAEESPIALMSEVDCLNALPPILDLDVKRAVLVHRACTDSMMWMQELIDYILKG